jgi:hypothetical protein
MSVVLVSGSHELVGSSLEGRLVGRAVGAGKGGEG